MIVSTDKAPKAIGPYSQAVKIRNMVYTSGQIALNPKTGELIDGGIEEQTAQVLENLKSILEAAGASLDNAIKVTVFLNDINDFSKMNEIYSKYFKNKPARSTVQVACLPKKAKIEIDVIAEF